MKEKEKENEAQQQETGKEETAKEGELSWRLAISIAANHITSRVTGKD